MTLTIPRLLMLSLLGGCLPPLPEGKLKDTSVGDSNAETDTDTDSDADTDSDTDTDSDADSDTEPDPDADADGDGYLASTDCDDGDPSVNPGMEERCATGKDDDCSGSTNDADALGCTVFDQDSDGDGYGGTVSACLCRAEGAFTVSNQDDCDDSNAAVNPSEAEVCNDFLDNDCDGAPDLSCGMASASVTTADLTLTETLRSSADFSRGLTTGDLNGDGAPDVASSDGQGWTFVEYGPLTRSLDMATADVVLAGESSWWTLKPTLSAADVDTDGVDDLVIGGGTTVYILGGGSLASGDVSSARTILSGVLDASGGLATGDVTGDGTSDVVTGKAGSAYVFAGPLLAGAFDSGDALATLQPTDSRALGVSMATGDVDGDGVADVVIGDYAGAEVYQGGSLHGSMTEHDAMALLSDTGHAAGESVCMGDVDGDGLADVGVGAWGDADNVGKAYVVFGSATLRSSALSAADATVSGVSSQGYLGFSVSCDGDFDADGFADFVVGEPHRATLTGTAYVFLGPISGSLLPTGADVTVSGSTTSQAVGNSLAAGDVDADGYDDLLVGALVANTNGSVFAFLGGGL